MKTGQTKLRGKKPRTEKVWQSQSLKKPESENTSIPPYSRRGFFVTYPRAYGHARTLAREVRVLEQSSHKIRKGG